MNEREKNLPDVVLSAAEITAQMEVQRKRAIAKEAQTLCKAVWTEAMNTKDSFGVEDADLDAFIANAEETIMDPSAKYADPDSFLNDGECPVFVRGDFSIIEGQAKSRKTFLSTLLVSLIGSNGTRPSGSRFTTPTEAKTVLWIDTEQGKPRTARIIARLRKMGADKTQIIFLSMRELGAVSRFKTFVYFVLLLRPDFVLLDGATDLMNDPNNIAEAAMIRQLLLTISSKCDCHITAIIHTNEKGDSSTARGHVGSELTRKCSTVIHLEAMGELTKATYSRTRDKAPDSFYIKVVEVDKYPLPEFADPCELPVPKTNKGKGIEADLEALRDFCKSKFGGVRNTALADFLKSRGLKGNTIDNRIKKAVDEGYIEKHESTGLYYPKN